MSNNPHDAIDAAVRAAMLERAEAIEAACAKALQAGDRGVIVVTDRLGGFMGAEPDVSVPYGHIYEVRVDRPDA
jgi:hypothetical protein